MLNKEKYEKEIVEMAINNRAFGIDKTTNELIKCFGTDCRTCKFNDINLAIDCKENRKNWANSEYKEPKTFTNDEKTLIRVLDKVKYVVRDYNGFILLKTKKPMKNNYEWFGGDAMYCTINLLTSATFSAIKWEDDEPTSREEILGE